MLSKKTIAINCGNPTSFQQKYKTYFLPLKYFALKYINDPELACDFIQDIFMTLWSNHQQFENEIALKVYLYRSVRNICLNHLRDSRKYEQLDEQLTSLQSEDTFMHHLIETEIYSSLKTAFQNLPPKTQEIYRLSLDGKSHAEISELLKISVNTVKKHKNMAHHLLRHQLKDLFLFVLYLHG